MSFKFVPFPLCHNDSGFLHSLCFLHCLSSLCSCCVLAHPPCLRWVMSSQLPDLNLNIIFSEELFWITSHSPSFPSHPHLSESCHRSHNTSCLFSGSPLQWRLYICSCNYSNHALCFPIRWQTIWGQETSVSAHHCMPLSSPGPGNSGLGVYWGNS